MKRHLNFFLQRKRTEFDDANDAHRPVSPGDSNGTVQTKDGYDWLHLIKQAQPSRAPAH
ncbi:MAG TPA: hypothetical protein VIM06_01370 [Rhodanobacter sp.]